MRRHEAAGVRCELDTDAAVLRPRGPVRRVLAALAVHDWLIGAYMALLAAAVLTAAPHPLRTACVWNVLGLLAFMTASVGVVRGGLLTHAFAAPLLYRLGVYGTVQASYFLLRDVLPVVSPGALDRQLYAIDVAIFGVEPAIWMDAFVSGAVTEWFAFFYLSYFVLLACYVLPLLLFSRRTPLVTELGLGMFTVVCVGQLLYLVVPGWGPHVAFAGAFAHPLPDGRWLDAVRDAVAFGGAQKDIFPSLHTAAPMVVALFAFRHRRTPPFRYVWHATWFITLNIVIATMFLRWHYAIDVVAGAALAVAAHVVAVYVTPWEARRREARGLTLAWPPFFDAPSRGHAAAPPRARHPRLDST
jgi:hypothetical protein